MRFIDPSPPGKIFDGKPGKRLFIPAGVHDNKFLLAADPGYVERLQNLRERDQRALLYGDWNVFEGQFFTEWREETHVCAPFNVSDEEAESVIGSALYNKNRRVEERLDVKIGYFKANPWQKYSESLVDLKASIDSSDGAFDVIAGWSAHIPTLAVDV